MNSSSPTEPLVPYRVTVAAVNLAGPGEQEMKDFFTREGGVCLIMQVVYMTYILLSMYPTYGPVSHEVRMRQIIILNLVCVIFMDCLVLNQLDTWFACHRLNV